MWSSAALWPILSHTSCVMWFSVTSLITSISELEILVLFRVSPYRFRSTVTVDPAGCDPCPPSPLSSHKRAHTAKAVVSSPQCFISLPVRALSPTGNDIHTKMCIDMKSAWTENHCPLQSRTTHNTLKKKKKSTFDIIKKTFLLSNLC